MGYTKPETKRAWKLANIEMVRECRRAWLKTEKGKSYLKAARSRYKTGSAGKASHRRDARKYRNRNPEKIIAHFIVNRAIKRGLMTRKPCIICGAEKTHAHHIDYSKPYDVTWLCHIHHMQEHNRKVKG